MSGRVLGCFEPVLTAPVVAGIIFSKQFVFPAVSFELIVVVDVPSTIQPEEHLPSLEGCKDQIRQKAVSHSCRLRPSGRMEICMGDAKKGSQRVCLSEDGIRQPLSVRSDWLSRAGLRIPSGHCRSSIRFSAYPGFENNPSYQQHFETRAGQQALTAAS